MSDLNSRAISYVFLMMSIICALIVIYIPISHSVVVPLILLAITIVTGLGVVWYFASRA